MSSGLKNRGSQVFNFKPTYTYGECYVRVNVTEVLFVCDTSFLIKMKVALGSVMFMLHRIKGYCTLLGNSGSVHTQGMILRLFGIAYLSPFLKGCKAADFDSENEQEH